MDDRTTHFPFSWLIIYLLIWILCYLQEIVRCFTKESSDNRLKPLTYQDVIQQKFDSAAAAAATAETSQSTSSLPVASPPPRPELTRQNSIELKTPGLGTGDGFIHTTLCRLPLDCLSENDISLEQLHRLCREATATMSGHRMVISKFRFLETVGRGGLVRSDVALLLYRH